jgi:hypothetical protein
MNNHTVAKFGLGKIHGKFIILDCIAFAMNYQEAILFFGHVSKSYRTLMIENMKIMKNTILKGDGIQKY